MGNILSHTIHEVGINQCLLKELESDGAHVMRRAIELNGAAKLAMGGANPATTVMLLTAAALLKLHTDTQSPPDVLAAVSGVIKDVVKADNDDNDESFPF